MTVLLLLLTVFVCSTYGYTVKHWLNNWDKPIDFSCSQRKAIGRITSVYSSKYKDRRWDFICHYIGVTEDCTETKRTLIDDANEVLNDGYVNKFHEDLTFDCPNNGVLVGIKSYNVNNYADRKYKFKCCTSPILIADKCTMTNYINDYHSRMNLKLDFDEVITGIYSHFNSTQHDRIWKVNICKLHVYGH